MRVSFHGGRAALLMAGVAWLWPAGNVFAQQNPSSAPSLVKNQAVTPGIEQVVVTATRKAQLLRKVPMSVEAVSGTQIKKLQIFDFKDVQELTPGLELSNNAGRDNTATLRGIAFDPDSGTAPAVDTYFNEIPVDAQTAFTAIYDVGQFQVLNGPQGLFRGRTSPAGSITITSQPASATQYGGYIEATGTDRGAYNFQGAVNFPIIQDKLAIRIAGVDDDNRLNDVHDVVNNTQSFSDTKSTRISVLFDPTPDITLNFMWQYLYNDRNQLIQVDGPGALLPSGPLTSGPRLIPNGPSAGPGDYIAVSDGPNSLKHRDNLFTFSGDWRLDDATISLIAGHENASLIENIDLDHGNAIPNYNQLQRDEIAYELEYTELRIASNGRDFWNYMAGASYYRLESPTFVSEPNNEYLTGVPGFSFFPNYSTIPINVGISVPGQNTTYSAFVASTFQLAQRWKLELGLRYSYYRTHQQSFLSVNAEGAQVLSDFGTISPDLAVKSSEAVTGGGDISYTVTPEINAYFSYGHSYRPGDSAVGVTAPLANNLLITNAETSNAIELGTKGALDHNRYGFTADVFYQRFNGYLSRTPVAINASSAANGIVDSTLQLNFNGNAVSTGIEGQFDAKVTQFWNVGYNMSWVDAQFRNAKEPCNEFASDGSPFIPTGEQAVICSTNSRLADTAKFHMTLTSDYSYPLGQFTPFIRGLFTYAPAFHSSFLNYNYSDLPILNVYAGIRSPDSRWELTVFAKNALNINRITNLQSEGQALQSTVALGPTGGLVAAKSLNSGYTLINTTVPIEAGLSLRYSF